MASYRVFWKNLRLSAEVSPLRFMRITALWLAFFALALSAFVWLFHLLTPANLHFATTDNLATLENLLFGSAVGSYISSLARTSPGG